MIYRQPNSRFRSPADLNPRDREHFNVAQSLGANFTTADFLDRYCELYPARKRSSIIPSDYCFNRENKGNQLYPRFLSWHDGSRYSFVGLKGELAGKAAPADPLVQTQPTSTRAASTATRGATFVRKEQQATPSPATTDLSRLWARIRARLDTQMSNWRKRIDDFGQVASVRQRQSGRRCTDSEVFESLLRAVLSAATDWSKVESVLGSVRKLFLDFDVCAFAATSDDEIEDRFVPWFRARGAASQNLRRNLQSLARSASRLCEWSKQHGSAESYFSAVVDAAGGDPKRATLELGGYGRPSKLPGLGVALAAEALRNLGFDLAKPDRHVNRAFGAFGLVHFRDWKDQSGTKAPVATEGEMLDVMTAVEQLANSAHELVCFTDNAVWLLCAKSGLYLTNGDLAKLAL